MDKQDILFSTDLNNSLLSAIEQCKPDRIFILTDLQTHKLCMPILAQCPCIKNAEEIVLQGAGDIYKNMESLSFVWENLSTKGASRHSLLINLGGGMITDLGGFAASTFKRGIKYINIPTTLLAMVDASVGGKTGINFNELKNEIGVFNTAKYVLIDTKFLETLDIKNLLSGYAEMLKHGLISTTEHWAELLKFNLNDMNLQQLQQLVQKNILVKEKIVKEDPYEQNIRKALNFGHTIGHAFESLSLVHKSPILHGYAVAYGIVCELYLSAIIADFPSDKMHQTIRFIKENYTPFLFNCDEYEQLYNYMLHDKKNNNNIINFTFLKNIGDIAINQHIEKDVIFESLDFYREGLQ